MHATRKKKRTSSEEDRRDRNLKISTRRNARVWMTIARVSGRNFFSLISFLLNKYSCVITIATDHLVTRRHYNRHLQRTLAEPRSSRKLDIRKLQRFHFIDFPEYRLPAEPISQIERERARAHTYTTHIHTSGGFFYDLHPFPYCICLRFTILRGKTRLINDAINNPRELSGPRQ